jgi:regulator of protease activity HflC (stomatin/prohibitin superfamily)
MKNFKRIFMLVALFAVVCFCFTGCVKPYDKPEFQDISPSQSAFLVPLVGDSSNQNAFESEAMLNENKVATKQVQIPHRWVQTGRWNWVGEWKPSATLILVERKPVSRSWESGESTAASANKAIFGETSDNIGIYVGMNCTAMIEEKDAAKFLYRYNNTPLETIIDTDIKKLVEDRFNIEVAKVASTDLGVKKGEIITAVREYVVDYFKDYGITITVLGLKEGISFENPEIQKALDKKFESEQDLVIQQNKNEANLAKAEAEAEAAKIAAKAEADALLTRAEAEAEAIRVKGEAEAAVNKMLTESMSEELLAMLKYYEAWDGKLPTIVGGDTTILKDIQGIG